MTEQPFVLLLGTELDWHIAHLKAGIERSSRATVRVLDYKQNIAEFRSNSQGHYELSIDGEILPPRAAVYDRLLIFCGEDFTPNVPAEYQEFASREWIEFYHLFSALYGEKVINTAASRFHLSKPYQQVIAAAVGFAVPETVVSNGKDAVLGLFDRGAESAVVKALANPRLLERTGDRIDRSTVMTSRVARHEIDEADAREFVGCPQLFQREIVKDHELRVVWVQGHVFAFRINSQEAAYTEVDWRHGMQELRYDLVDLDTQLAGRIARFMEKMSLSAGSIDLIVDKDGEIWFLECNNQGAWGWLDELVDGAILKTWVDVLCSRAEAQVRAQIS